MISLVEVRHSHHYSTVQYYYIILVYGTSNNYNGRPFNSCSHMQLRVAASLLMCTPCSSAPPHYSVTILEAKTCLRMYVLPLNTRYSCLSQLVGYTMIIFLHLSLALLLAILIPARTTDYSLVVLRNVIIIHTHLRTVHMHLQA